MFVIIHLYYEYLLLNANSCIAKHMKIRRYGFAEEALASSSKDSYFGKIVPKDDDGKKWGGSLL